jgi:hypothetical protein
VQTWAGPRAAELTEGKHMSIDPHDLSHESRIVWLEDIGRLDYVRAAVYLLPFRARKPGRRNYPGRLVGFAALRPETPGYGGRFWRRLFWLDEHDRDSGGGPYLAGGAPCEAVDPRTVAPGVPGAMTARAWGGAAEAGGG